MKVLAIGAHFDDIEIGCGGSLLKHMKNNDDIYMLVITKSNYKDKDHTRLSSAAFKEGKKNAKYLGAELIIGNFKTLTLTANKKLVDYISEVVEDIKPDIVYTHFYGDQHLDHEAIGKASLICCRNVFKVLMYSSNSYQCTKLFVPNYFIEISDFINEKLYLIDNYKSEKNKIEKYKNNTEIINKYYGIKNNKQYCEGFMVSKIIEI